MDSFKSFDLLDGLNSTISANGLTKPTLVQKALVPLIKEGRDVIGLSATGSGKTLAFVLPILHRLAELPRGKKRRRAEVLILSPTRELATQTSKTARLYGKAVNIHETLVIGGVSYPPQIRSLQSGADIVVATPGRILDHLESGIFSAADIKTIILDEADQMLDFGFLPVIKQIMNYVASPRQVVMLSATMPKAVERLASEVMKNPEIIEATPQSRPAESVKQEVIYLEKSQKNMALLEILSQQVVEKAIVFVRTKFGADKLQSFLHKYGIIAVSLHGNKSQGQRKRALGQFSSGEVDVLVATDVAGRGLDIDFVSHVINVDLPNIAENYVHRIGRTARAGRSGVAISFCAKSERAYLRDIEKLIGDALPKRQGNVNQNDNKMLPLVSVPDEQPKTAEQPKTGVHAKNEKPKRARKAKNTNLNKTDRKNSDKKASSKKADDKKPKLKVKFSKQGAKKTTNAQAPKKAAKNIRKNKPQFPQSANQGLKRKRKF